MAAFTAFNARLPDPAFDVNDAGAQVTLGTGKKGPGFANVTVRSRKDTQVNRTNSGRGVMREQAAHIWEIEINYHPMTRDSFDVVQTFLDARNARMYPFYVVLPNRNKPKSTVLAATLAGANVVRNVGAQAAGTTYMVIDINNGALPFGVTNGWPSPGDFFNIDDPNDLNHQKTYKITRVETVTDYNSSLGNVNTGTVRIHMLPPLTRAIADNSVIRMIDPTFRVIAKSDVFEYNLNTDNLYQFSLSLEEILP